MRAYVTARSRGDHIMGEEGVKIAVAVVRRALYTAAAADVKVRALALS